MAVIVKHTKVSAVADGADTTVVRPSDWNADHTLTGLGTAAALDAGVANGVATLDSGGKVPVSELPAAVLGALSYQGTWNASTNTPTLASGVGEKGYYYVVSVAGTTDLDGIVDWQVGDWAVYSGTAWQKVDNTESANVIGPASATDNAIARYDSTTGKLIQNSVTLIDDTGNASGILSQQFNDGTAVTLSAGKMWYNGTTGSWNAGMGGGNITQQIGEELFRYGKASVAIDDSTLQLVYKTGTIGASGVISFAPAIAGITDADQIIGCATEPIALNGFGRVTTYGVINNITTDGTAYGETWANNDDIYYNPVTGGLTKTIPTAPNLKLLIGIVINAGSGASGSFIVKFGDSTYLSELSDTQISSPTGGQLLTYNQTDGYWKNTSLSAGTSITVTPTTAGALTITNTAPDQTVALTAGTGISTTGTYPNFTITNTAPSSGGTVTSVSGVAPVASSGGNTPAISMAAASTSTDGYLTSTDWNTFNGKGSGSVTSVAASVPSFLSIAGSPITSSGTLAISYSGTALPVANGGTGVTAAGTTGNVLTSNGSVWVSSAPASGNITTKGLYENAAIIAANYTIGTGNNAVSAGPITINSGVVVTVPSGSVWVVV